MTNDTSIECTIHWLADGREGQRDLILRDRSIAQIIPGLVDRLGLREYIDGPTQSVATLHPQRDSPPFAADTRLGEAGVRDGDHIWLILTPRFLPLTFHWTTGERQGEHEVQLPADRTIGEHIRALVNDLGLRELVDGPVKAVATLHPAPDAPAWDAGQTLLDLDVRIGASVWLNLAPRFMSVVLNWSEEGQQLQKQRYLSVSEKIGEHLDDLVGLLDVDAAVNGPSQSKPSLRTDPRRPALSLDQTLPQAGVRAGSPLWFTLTPTIATATVHYPTNTGSASRELSVPLTLPLNIVAEELGRRLGLNTTASSTLHPAAETRAWPSTNTLADHNVRDGTEIWLKLAPPTPAVLPWRFIAIAGAVLALVVIFLVVRGIRGGRQPQLTPIPVAVAPTSTAILPTTTPAPPTPTPSVPPTPTIPPEQDPDYARGKEAFDRGDWPTAAGAFERVIGRYPNDQAVRELLATTYLNEAQSSLANFDPSTGSPAALRQILNIVNQIFIHSPNNQAGHDLAQHLGLYIEGRESGDKGDWQTAITKFEQLRALPPDFLDVIQRLYNGYMALAGQLRVQQPPDLQTAVARCQQAVALPGIDISAAQQCVQDPSPKLRIRKIDETGDPRCVVVTIEGIDTTGWRLSIDGLRGRIAPFDAGKAQVCRLNFNRQQVTFHILDPQGGTVPGGNGVPTRGSANMYGTWP